LSPSSGALLDHLVHPLADRIGRGDDELVAVLQHGGRGGQLGLAVADSHAARAPDATSSSDSRRPTQTSVTVTRMSSTCPVGSRHSSLTLTESSSRSSRFTVHGTVATLGMPMRS